MSNGSKLFMGLSFIPSILAILLYVSTVNTPKKQNKESIITSQTFTDSGNRIVGEYNYTIPNSNTTLNLLINKVSSTYDTRINYMVKVVGSKEFEWCGIVHEVDSDRIYPDKVMLGYTVIPKCNYHYQFRGFTTLIVTKTIRIKSDTINYFIRKIEE